MKFMRFLAFALFTIQCCTSYANENEYIFVGQTESQGQTKAAFILELLENDLANHIQISESGDVYLKIDKLIAIPREELIHFINVDNNSQFLNRESISEEAKRAEPPKQWQCPYCYRLWNLGEKCTNRDCPTNRW